MLLPPILLLAGTGLIRRATGTISTVTAKVIATAGALGIAVVIAAFVEPITVAFNDTAIGKHVFGPNFLSNFPRLDVFCASLIPIGIALWWPGPIPASKRIEACGYGIAAALLPAVLQIISWPFIYGSDDGTWAVFAVDVFATVILAVWVTRHFIKSDVRDFLARPIVPPHIRRGLIRLYLILIIPWVIWSGYTAYEANKGLAIRNSLLDEFLNYSYEMLDDKTTPLSAFERRRIENARSALGRMASLWDPRPTTNDEIEERINKDRSYLTNRLTTSIYAMLAAAMPLLLYPIFLWILAGFQKLTPDPSEVQRPGTPTSRNRPDLPKPTAKSL